MRSKPKYRADPRHAYLNEIAARLLQLLKVSTTPAEDKFLAEEMLYAAGLWDQTMPSNLALPRFCNRLVATNPLLYEVIGEVRAQPQLSAVFSVEELMQALIPSEADVALM